MSAREADTPPACIECIHRRFRLDRPRHPFLRLEDAQRGRDPPAAQALHRAVNEDP